LLVLESTMQIPYDLEFVENRPPVTAHTVAIPGHFPGMRSRGPARERDAFDALLAWVHRTLSRLESGPPNSDRPQ
jgi:hypothetical protein